MNRLRIFFVCWYMVVSAAIAGGETSIPPQRLTLSELIQRISNPSHKKGAVRLLGRELEDRAPTTTADIEGLFSLISKEKGEIRQKAINAVSNTVDLSLKPAFIKGLRDKSYIVNAVSAGMCGKLKIKEASAKLEKLIIRLGPISVVVESDRERASIAAVFALGEIRDESNIPFLISLFDKMRGYEVMALIKYGKKVVPVMLDLVTATKQDFVREQAERVLLSIRDKQAIPLFEKEMANPDSPSRGISMRVLLNIDPEHTLLRILKLWETEGDPVITSILLNHLDHYQISDIRYGDFAEKILRASPKSDFRAKASSILGRIGGEKAKKALKDTLKDEDPLVRAFSARSLKRLELHPTSPGK